MIKVKFNTKEKLNEPHQKIFTSSARFKVIAAGRRFGKTYLSAYKLITSSLQREGIYYYIAPTFQQARDIIWKVLKEKTPKQTIKKINESRLEIELINNSTIQLKSAEKPDGLRGVSLCGAILDEFAMMRNSDDVWQEAIRPALSDKQGYAMFISSPKGRNYFYDLYNQAKQQDDWESYQFTTLDGGYVPEYEIESAKRDLDDRTFRQEYLATFESYDGLVCPDFDRVLNSSLEIISEFDTLIIGIDFNVNKMPCGIFVKRNKELHLLDFIYGSFNTQELMNVIQIKYPKHNKIFHTDATGKSNKSSAGGQTDISIIQSFGYQVLNLNSNPNIIDRVNAFNSMVKSANNTRRFFVSPKLTKVIETLEKHYFAENGLPNKTHEYHDDIFDAISYAVYNYADIIPRQTVTHQPLNFR